MYTTIDACRICRSPSLRPSFTILAPIVSCFPEPRTDWQDNLVRCPLDIVECTHCGLVQLLHAVAPSVLYGGEYWYESGVNERMREELATVVLRAHQFTALSPGDAVLDIGANDGTLLAQYPDDLVRVAVDASPTFVDQLTGRCDHFVQGFFPDCVDELLPPFHVITTIAMFYDLADPVTSAEQIRRLLHPYGVWICQFQDLAQQVRDGIWDNFVHEHVTYLTLTTFAEICERAGLKIVDAEYSSINGGSLRCFVMHQGVRPQNPRMVPLVHQEAEIFHPGWAPRFASRMQRNIEQLQAFLAIGSNHELITDLYGASTKGNTLLQVTGVSQSIRAAWERNPRKVGRLTCTGVPIIDEEMGRATPPDVLLATIWQFKSQIIHRERETLKTVRMLLPLPEATLVDLYDSANSGTVPHASQGLQP
jgi:NDP-4-keto-2,6-dideoxyhexose 3-C-methyltransferase